MTSRRVWWMGGFDLDGLRALDDAARNELTQVKGAGRFTADGPPGTSRCAEQSRAPGRSMSTYRSPRWTPWASDFGDGGRWPPSISWQPDPVPVWD
jgi:hypothetical protein